MMNKKLFIATIGLAGTFLLSNCASTATSTKETTVAKDITTTAAPNNEQSKKTLENLQAAYNGESNAKNKYELYAKKADEEGYAKVASLFRAAAHAEGIHIKNHAEVIKAMGAEPKADIKNPDVKTTKENLEDGIKGETYERDKMYTDFMAQARDAGNKEALKTFNFAKQAEAEHAKLYQQAADNLNDWKAGKMTFYVCSTCGYTTSDANIQKCPVDFTPREKFDEIS